MTDHKTAKRRLGVNLMNRISKTKQYQVIILTEGAQSIHQCETVAEVCSQLSPFIAMDTDFHMIQVIKMW